MISIMSLATGEVLTCSPIVSSPFTLVLIASEHPSTRALDRCQFRMKDDSELPSIPSASACRSQFLFANVLGKHVNPGVVLLIPRGSNPMISKYFGRSGDASSKSDLGSSSESAIVCKFLPDCRTWATPEPPGPPGCSKISWGLRNNIRE